MPEGRILIVEDENIVARDLAQRLSRMGYEVCGTAATGEAAIASATETQPDLVLMDVMLRGPMDGIEAAEEIRRRRDVPIVFLTAYSDDATFARAKVTEPYAYILKPFQERELGITIETALFRHRAERQIRDRERWLATVLRSIGDAVIATDTHGAVTFLNPVAEHLTGWDSASALGQECARVFRIVDEETRLATESPAERALREGRVVGLPSHTLLISRQGAETPVDDSASPMIDDRGEVRGAVLVFRDVADQRRIEALSAAHQFLKATIDAIPARVAILDAGGAIQGTNAAWSNYAGENRFLGAGAGIGVDYLALCRGVGEGGAAIAEGILGVAARKRGTFTTEYGWPAPSGQRRYAIHVTRFAGEGPARMVVLHEDVTERWSAEEALRKSNKSLAEAMDELQRTQQEVIQQERLRALGQMASGIAHDLNNTLTPILGLTDLFIEFPAVLDDRDVLLEQLRTIHTASQDAASVIARLRDFYRPGNGHGVTHDVDLSLLAEQAIALTRPKWHDEALARGAVIRFAREYGEMPVLSANAAELREALANLIINAVDAMPRGGTILVRTAVRERTAEVVIGDTGAGMTEDVLRRCVEPFFSTKGEQGTGLGLSVVYGTAQRHNGSVHIASKPGEGTSVTLRLPLGTPAAPGQAQSVAPAARPTLRILLVDDEPVVRRVMAECLTRDGHHPTIAADGQEALSLLVKGPFDLMITDKAMPRMNGEDLALAARNIAPSMPIILLTGFGDLILSTGTKPRGVDEVVSKPATLRVLREAIARVAGH